MFEGMTTVSQGAAGLGLAIAYFTVEGYIVSVPLNDNQNYDLVVDKGDGLKRVQVKTTGYKIKPTQAYTVQLKSVRPNKTENVIRPFNGKTCDILFVVTKDNDKYLIPSSVVDGKNSISLGTRVEEYKI